MKFNNQFLLATLLVCPFLMLAQTTSKSKSKDKIYEKGKENRGVKVRNVTSMNSASVDFSPNFYQNGLVFVSTHGAGPIESKTGRRYFDLFFAPFDPNGEPVARQDFSAELNANINHEGPVTFSQDWKTVIFSRNADKPAANGKVNQQIYEATRGLFDWEKTRSLPFNSNEFSCMHPALSSDGQTLYFTSDMPGGFGGSDIWQVKRLGEGWSKPENLGPAFNTDGREAFPATHESGALFFASNRHNSLGGLDIFMAKKDADGLFTDLTNIGAPFNGPGDDLGFILDASTTRGFFSSERPNGYGEEDIYSFEIEDGLHGINKPVSVRAGIEIVDALTGQPMQGAAIRILERSQDGYLSGGDFYNIELVPDEFGSNLAMKLVRKDADELGPTDLYSNAVGQALFDFAPGRDYLLVVSKDGYRNGDKLYQGEEFPSGNIKIALDPRPQCQPVRGSVKTDAWGTPIANAVVKFFDKKSGHQEMVRTNLAGDFDFCLNLTGDWEILAEKDGFIGKTEPVKLDGKSRIFREIKLKQDKLIGNDAASAGLPPQPLEVGSVIVLDKIYYDFNKATLNESACRQLEGLIRVMKQFPSMEIDLAAHTDTRGTSPENLKLSSDRAKNAKIYLVARGIAAARIEAIGKGENEPRNRCADGIDCPEEEHAFNRRTEVKVRKISEGVKVEYKGQN